MSLASHIPPIYPSKDVLRDPDSWSKVSSYVSKRDWQTINSVAAQSGAISYIIDHAIHLTADAIRSSGYVPIVDTERFLNWLRERTFSQPTTPAQGPTGDDTGRAASAREPATHPSNLPTSPRSNVETGSRGGRRKASPARA